MDSPLQRTQIKNSAHRILIIESDNELRISLSRLLSREKFEVFPTANPEQAAIYLDKMMIGCVIFGLNQPFKEAISHLKSIVCHKQKPKVLVLSSFDWQEVQKEMLNIKINHFLTKPVKQEQLIKQIVEHKSSAS